MAEETNKKKYLGYDGLVKVVEQSKTYTQTYTDSAVSQKSQVQLINVNENESITEILSTLKIHKLSKEKYDEELANGNIDETALYLTPDEDVDLSGYATVEQLNEKADAEHIHEIADITNLQSTLDAINESISDVSKLSHTHSISDVDNLQETLDSNLAESKSYTDTKTADLVSNTVVDNKVSTHNVATDAHNDIRLLIDGLTTRLNTLADSDDTTLDQMSEIVDYIKTNKDLIEAVTTSKVNVSDIVDNLTTNVSNQPLSASQGVAIKVLIDNLQAVVDGKANTTHEHFISDITNLQDILNDKVSIYRTVNGKSLVSNVVLSAADVGADASGSADMALSQAKEYTDNAVSQMTTVQIVIWEDDD